ncbi:extracellular solute-binding protein [Clostridium sp. SYSU_GA19001]|uniref:extracellular solute-binding protein n=1 Tax=Clostridium caldaquaticum TaxID=2940653 RepID=UPI002077090B|nr:extracellular solute-binding protein [Clostridium caldaquaticum]MCM8710738.1 extracellular solute-binding protein [Clostridium caldaquaticum]
MLKSRTKFITLVLTLTVASSVLTGCSIGKSKNETASEGNDNVVTLKFFDKNTGDAFTDEVAQEITKRTGVKVEIQQPTGDPLEKLNLMLASGDYPDIVLMDRSNDIVNKYITTGALIPLNDLIDKYGADVKKMYGDTLNKIRYQDGKNYYLSNWYGKDPDAVFGFIMRQDMLKQVALDKASNGQYFTQDEFIKVLKDIKAKYPTVNGKEIIPLTFQSDNQGGIVGTFKGMFGLKTYYQINGELKYDVRDPKYLDMLKYMNALYREGLIDKEWVVNKKELWQQKLSNGYTFATTGAYWDVTNSNTALKGSLGNDAQLYAYKVVANGVDPSKTTYGGRSSLGWDAIGITKNCKNPEVAMKFINFLASEEGQYLMMWGVEGKTWNMVDGKHKPTDEILKQFKDNFNDTAKKTGVRHWTWFIKNGLGSDGTPYDMATKYDKDQAQIIANKNLPDTYWDTAEFDGLTPKGGTPEALINQKVQDIFNQAFPKIVNAASEAECVSLYNKMIADIDAAGLSKVEQIINDNYKQRMSLWK